MISIVLEAHWSNNPIPVNELIQSPDLVFDVPLGIFTGLDAPVTSVQGKTGAVELTAEDVHAEPVGAVIQVKNELIPQIESLADSKLDKVDYEQHFRGLHDSYADLIAAVPVGKDGDYAHIKESQNFGRLSAIWSGIAGVWNISGVNIGSSTDEVPEGQENLYFKAERVRQTTLAGLPQQPAIDVISTDTLLDAISKLQAQLKASKVVWVDAAQIGIPRDSNILTKGVDSLEFARIDGNLWVRGGFYNDNIAVGAAAPPVIFTITDIRYKVRVGDSSLANNPISFFTVSAYNSGAIYTINMIASSKCTTEAEALTCVQEFRTQTSLPQNNTGKRILNPVCLGKLVIQ